MTRDEALWKARNAADDEAETWWREIGNEGASFNWSERFLASLAASGFAIVPVRPTDEMLTVGAEWVGDAFKTIRAYRAMLAAAQKEQE